jgi:hypothetical protein
MPDRDALEPWIDERHLDEGDLTRHRDAFGSHPARLVLVRDLLRSDAADRLARFVAEDAAFATEYGLYSNESGVTREEWEGASDQDRFFRFGKMSGPRPESAFSDGTMAYVRFRKFAGEPAFRGLMEALTGIELGPTENFGVHAFRAGDYLRDHDDNSGGRRLAFVLYLSPGWTGDLGGELTMVDAGGGVTTVPPAYNSMVVFDATAGSRHRVEPVLPAAGDRARCTFGGWFPDRP